MLESTGITVDLRMGETYSVAPGSVQSLLNIPANRLSKRFLVIAGLAGIIVVILAISVPLASTVACGPGCGTGAKASNPFSPDGSFSWGSNALSDIGVSGAAGLFNYGLMVIGLPFVAFAVGFSKVYARSPPSKLGSGLMIVAAFSTPLIGVFTEANITLHWAASLGWFVFFPLGMILVGVSLVRQDTKSYGYYSVVLGAVSLVVIFVGLSLYATLGVQTYIMRFGGFARVEFAEILLVVAWLAYSSLLLLGGARAQSLAAGYAENRSI